MPPRKNHTFSHQQNIWIVTYYGKFKSPTALRKEFCKHFKLSPRQLPHSYTFSKVINRFMASGDVSPSKFPGPPRTKIIEENIDAVRNRRKAQFFNFPFNSNFQLPSRAGEHSGKISASLNKDQIITAVNDILPRTQACIETVEGHLSINWNPSRKYLIVYFWLLIFFIECQTVCNTNNIVITV